MIGKTISHYKILEKLGEGGMGLVYKAEDIKLKRIVALKFLPSSFSYDQDAITRFIHEAQSASALDHQNICTIFEISETEDKQYFISMAYYEGETLKDKIRNGKITSEETIRIVQQIASGLSKTHNRGIIHRDIKPANIFITKEGIVKILDFGLAKSSGRTQITQIGTTVGTCNYMSPEQARGEEVDQRTDIWSLGILMFEMLAGTPPFNADYDQAIIYSILNTIPDFSKIPHELIPILQKTIAKNPKERYNSAEELIIDLNACQNSSLASDLSGVSAAFRRINLKTKIIFTSILIILTYLVVIYFPKIKAGNNKITTSVSNLKMIVVLPFENLGSPDDDYFADGVRDEISNKLSSLASIGVISRNSAEKYAESKKTTKEIGKELGVDYILEGTIRWAKGSNDKRRIRIIPQLVRVSDDMSIWSESFDKVIDDIFSVQNDIAQNVVDKLGIKLLPNQILNKLPPTNNLEAYDYYLKAYKFQSVTSTKSDLMTCAKLYEKAIELDPNFAEAYALCSIAYLVLNKAYNEGKNNFEKAKKYLQKAKELKPDIVQVHLAKAFYLDWATNDIHEEIKECKKILEIDPNNAEANAMLGWIYGNMGKLALGLEYELKSLKLDPSIARYSYNIALTYSFIRDYENAEKYYKRAIELGPNDAEYYTNLANIYIDWKGDTKLARNSIKIIKNDEFSELYYKTFIDLDLLDRKFDKVIQELKTSKIKYDGSISLNYQMIALVYRYKKDFSNSKAYFDTVNRKTREFIKERPDNLYLHIISGLSYAALGNKDKAIIEMKKRWELRKSKEYVQTKNILEPLYLAQMYILLGDYESSLNQIENLLSKPTGFSVNRLKLDPLYDPIRNLAGYKELIKKYSSFSND